jgi:DNA-binding beta-propeller fold protein YncE
MGYSMRFVSHKVSIKLPAFIFVLLLFAGSLSPASGQTAPYILPYTMSTYAGPVLSTTIGEQCGNYVTLGAVISSANYVSLDTLGDGCQALNVSIGSDPHDIRVDPKGNVYYIDNASKGLVHKIFGSTGLEIAYAGSLTGKVCSSGDKFGGDGCLATDGAASTSASNYTAGFSTMRGITVAPNGDLLIANYSQNIINKVPAAAPASQPGAAAGIMVAVAGDGTGGFFNSAQGTSEVSSPRGVGVDPNTGTVYIADTGNDIIRKSVFANGVYTVSSVTAPGGAAASGSAGCSVAPYSKSVANGAASSAMVCAPEDVQVDLNGNVFIVDNASNVVRAIYNGSGTLPGISSPVTGNIYLIAGYNALNTSVTQNTYPTDGSTPTFPATTISMNIRKISLDSLGNIYIPDDGATSNSVWFVDHATGYARLLAGSFGMTAPAASPAATRGCSAPFVQTDAVGDGCPGPDAGLLTSLNDNPGAAADNQGNLYLSDSEGVKLPAVARIRKLLSGLNFPATAVGSSATQQTLFLHFTLGDTAAATAPFASSSTDFAVGTPNCPAANTDTTSDCYVPVTFKPTKPGYDTATFTVKSTLGGINSYLLTGTGTAPSLAIDPGSTSVVNTSSAISNAQGIIFDGAGNAYIADTNNNRVLFYSVASGTTTVFAGTGSAGYSGDGSAATAAKLTGPKAVTIDTDGNVYIADSGNNVIRKVNAAGVITTYAGGAATVCSQSNNSRGDGCPGLSATFSNPSGIVADNLGNLYVSDTGNNVIRQINTLSWVSTLAGGATSICTTNTDTFGDGCSALLTIFSSPIGLAFDKAGNFILVADTGHSVIRKIELSNSYSYSGSGSSTTAGTILINGVAVAAGNGQAGSSVSSSNSAILSQLNAPTGVAVDAAENIYIADTQNHAVRLVNSTTGLISTIVGINASSGTGTVPGAASAVELNSPAAVAVSPTGQLFVVDTGNNRILSDVRTQVAFNFGRINLGSSSPTQTFTELNIGTAAAALSGSSSTAFLTPSGGTGAGEFTLTSPSSGGCTNGQSLAPGASCILQGQFTPTATGNYTETYTESAATPASAGGVPTVSFTGVGAVLTPTTGTVAQIVPATGNSQYGGSVTLGVTIAATCNTAAPSCYPTGTVRIIVDGTAGSPLTLSGTATASQAISGLAVGGRTISCSYSGDDFYAASTCPDVTIVVAPASTTSLLSTSNNNQPQFTSTQINATVLSNTSGIPTGTVSFYANGISLGPAVALNSSTGVASLLLSATYDSNGNIATNTTLAPGTYSLTCTYNESANFATSNCPAFSFTVAPAPVGFNTITVTNQSLTWTGTLLALPCPAADLYMAGTSTPGYNVACTSGTTYTPAQGVNPTVTTADGSTTDATLFFSPTNTMSGTLTFACSGLPATTTCTFSPTSIALTPTTQYVNPYYVDVTFWTDLQSKAALRTPSIGHGKAGSIYAARIGWPMALFGLAALLFFRRRNAISKGLSLLSLLLVMVGSSLALSGCAGPGAYQPVLTPAGTYPITITVTDNPGGASTSAVVNFKVASPGITGQE